MSQEPRGARPTRVPEGASPVFPPSVTCVCDLISLLFSQPIGALAGIKGQLRILTVPPLRAGVSVPALCEPGRASWRPP